MFPDKLDNANVIEYSCKSNYGNIGGSPNNICYFAICRYNQQEQFYLFYCDENKEVIFDDLSDKKYIKSTGINFTEDEYYREFEEL